MSGNTLDIPGTDPMQSKSVQRVCSTVEASTFLLRLAGKQGKPTPKADEEKDARRASEAKPAPEKSVKDKKQSKGPQERKQSNSSGKDFKTNGTGKDSKERKGKESKERKQSTGTGKDFKERKLSKSMGKDQRERKQSNGTYGDVSAMPIKFDENDPLNIEMPDLGEEMDEATLATFRDLFNMLDQSNTGIITVDNLYEEMKRVDSEITYSEVEDVLKKVDKDGNGEIDFDEFLYHMIHSGGELFGEDGSAVDEDQKMHYSRRRRLFYSAITQFSLKQTLAEIEKTFKKQAPHVISHYTAGARLIGLTTRQLERQMKRMQKAASQNDSPYAKPLQFVHMGAKKIVHRKKVKSPCLRDKQIVASCRELNQEMKQPEQDTSVENLSQEISNTMKLFAQQRMSIVSKFQDANLIMQLREKIGKVKAKLQSTDEEEDGMPEIHQQLETDETVKKKHSPPKRQQFQFSVRETKKMSRRKLIQLGQGWTTPRIQYMAVALPSMKMKLKSSKPTFNDLHRIRKKANEAIDLYYHNLRQTEIRNAWDHWDRLYADVILPNKLLENFRTVYSAYSPHREEDAFVVCPWKPGPFRFIRHMPKTTNLSLPNSPTFMMNRSRGNKVISSNAPQNSVSRPFTSMSSVSSPLRPPSSMSIMSSQV